MSASQTCPSCGAPLSGDTLEGLCSDCLGKLALGASQVSGSGSRVSSSEAQAALTPPRPAWGEAATANGPSGPFVLPVTEKPGDRIGRYKLLQQIGQGGCGVVYMAEQEEPVRRRVALKVIKLGMDTKQVIARFEAERQALALMDHPNIAKVFDSGATETGRPYFVMELVRGIRITDYCDQNNLSTRERLELFIHVCQAVQHAHQKGIIHRDIKPSNILIADHDGVPVPKVIDFGIAKATTDQWLTDKTLFTALEQFIGTPAYMSPEQANLSGLDIDTRTDIYSLGVLLYELLTGKTPFDAKELLQAGLDEMRRTIREKEPARPSTRLTQELVAADRMRNAERGTRNAESPDAERRTQDSALRIPNSALTPASSRRLLQIKELVKLLRGDLDWIVMKCLEKDRTRRYETANGVGMDIQRHLSNEPVVACPPTSLYRFQKLVRRNKLTVAAGGTVAVALVLGVIASTLQAVRATRAEREQSRLRSHAEASQKKSETEAVKATAISNFLRQLLRSANPDALKGSENSVRQQLDNFSEGLANQLKDQPEVEAAIRATIGKAYYQLGVVDKARMHHERALTLRRRIFGDQAEQVAESLVEYAWTFEEFRQGQHAKGETYVREALDIYRKRGTAGQPVIHAYKVLQRLLLAQGRIAEVDAVTEEALTFAGKSPGVEFPDLASMIHGLAEVKNGQSQHAKAESLALKAVAMHRRLHGADHPETAWALLILGRALRGQQKLTDAEAALREALWIFRKQYSSENEGFELAMGHLEAVLAAKGDSTAVEALHREVLAGQFAALGNGSPAVAKMLSSLAASLYAQGKSADAEKTLREAMDIIPRVRAEKMIKLPSALRKLAEVLKSQGKFQEAEKLYEETIQAARQKLGETNTVLGQLHRDFGVFLREGDKSDAATEQYHKSLLIRRAIQNDDLAQVLCDLGFVLVQTGKSKDAEPYLRESLALYRKLHQQEGWATAWNNQILAQALHGQQKLPEAEQAYREALVAYAKTERIGGGGYALVLQSLVRLLNSENKLAEAETLLKDLLSQQRQSPGEQHIAVPLTLLQLADVLKTQKKGDEAVNRYREALEIASNLRADATNANALNAMAWRLAIAENPTSWDAAVAVELAQKAVAATSRKNPRILGTLAAAYAAAGQFTNAVRHQQEVIALMHVEKPNAYFDLRLKFYESNVRLGDHAGLAQRTIVLFARGQFAEAEPLARECLVVCRGQIPDDWRTFNAQSLLGGSLLGQKKFTEAEPLLLSGYEGMKQREDKIPTEGKSRLQESLQRLVQLYEATGRPDQAAAWKKKLAEFDNKGAENKAASPKEATK